MVAYSWMYFKGYNFAVVCHADRTGSESIGHRED